jgi:hypothetical protein
MRRWLGAAAIACLVASGCSDGRPMRIVPENAGGTVRTLAQLRTSIYAGDGFGSANLAGALGPQGALILQPDEGGNQRYVLPHGDRRFILGTCGCDEGGCTFSGCGDDAGTWTVDGTITINQGVYTFDVHTHFDNGGSIQDWDLTGDIAMDDTTISGDLSGDGTMTITDDDGDEITAAWSFDLDYTDVTYDMTGCATAGDVDVSGKFQETVFGRTFRWADSGTVTFNTCGMYLVEE